MSAVPPSPPAAASPASAGPSEPAGVKLPESLLLVLLLFPGFVSERVANYFATFPSQSDTEVVVSALSFTLFNLVIAWFVLWLMRLVAWVFRHPRSPKPSLLTGGRWLLAPYAFVVLAVAVLVGWTWAYAESEDLVFEWLGTARQSRSDAWTTSFARNARRAREPEDEFLDRVQRTCIADPSAPPSLEFDVPEEPRQVRVVLSSGEAYQGFPAAYTDNSSDRWVYLQTTRTDKLERKMPAAESPKTHPVETKSRGKNGKPANVVSAVAPKALATEAEWTAQCVAGPHAVLLSAGLIQAVEFIDPKRPRFSDTGPPAPGLVRGRKYLCGDLRKIKQLEGQLRIAPDFTPCGARVPQFLVTKEPSKDK